MTVDRDKDKMVEKVEDYVQKLQSYIFEKDILVLYSIILERICIDIDINKCISK